MISIIGSGLVGSAVAFLAASTTLDDIQLVNRHKDKAKGHALDISNSIPKDSEISVLAADYSDIADSSVLVITASAAPYTTSRTEILTQQATMIKDIADKIKKYANPDAKILVVTNPVDALTYVLQKEASWPKNKVIGIASSLDSSRFRYLLSKELKTKQNQIHDALVLGEHGDSMVPIFSHAKFHNSPILDHLDNSQIEQITKDLRGYWKILREFKGPSVYGIAKNTYDVIKSIIKKEKLMVPASVLLDGQYQISDVCMGVPIQISDGDSITIQEINLDPSEINLLQDSANIIKQYIQTCNISVQT